MKDEKMLRNEFDACFYYVQHSIEENRTLEIFSLKCSLYSVKEVHKWRESGIDNVSKY